MILSQKRSVAMACSSLMIASATAQTQNHPSDQILVTAKGNQTTETALHTSHVFTLEDIEAAQVKDIPALLTRIAGVSLSESGGRGSSTSIFVRGTSNSQTIVLIDGVRVGSATLGAAALNSYPIEAIERIEVLKGPFSGIYGADAVGGVIQLFTKKGGDGRGAIRATFGNDSLQEYDLALNGGNETYSFHVAAHSEDTDGIDRTSILTDGNEDQDEFEQRSLSLGGQVNWGRASNLQLSILSSDSTVEFDNTFGADPGLVTENEALSTALAFNTTFNQDWAWKATLGLNEDEAITNGNFPSAFTTNRETFGTEISGDLSANNTLTFGADYYQEDIESTNDFPVTDRDNTGAFVQFQSLGNTVGVVASLRYDDNSAYGTDTNGSLAVNYNVTDELRVIASYGTAFVAPSFNRLYFPFFGNPDLLPEESESIELSIAGNSGSLDWRVSAYRTDIENLFSFDPATFLSANIGEAELEGIEGEVSTNIANWSVSINADILSATNQATGIELDDRAERSLSVTASRSFDALDLRFDLRSESDRFDNSGTQIAGYGLFDISASYDLTDDLNVSANIDNVFDKDYTLNLIGANNRYNTEGRQAKISVRYSF